MLANAARRLLTCGLLAAAVGQSEKILADDLKEGHALAIGKQVLRDNALELFPQLKNRLWKHTGKKLEPATVSRSAKIDRSGRSSTSELRGSPPPSARLPESTQPLAAGNSRGERVSPVEVTIAADAPAAPEGTLAFSISDAATRAQTPCRIHLQSADGQPVLPREYPTWHDHFVCDGKASFAVAAGEYRYEVEHGPEYRPVRGLISVKAGEVASINESIGRIVDLAGENWWSGEMHIHRPLADVPLLMRAEDLHIGLVITWWNDTNLWKGRALPAQPAVQIDKDRFYDSMGGEDERAGGALLFAHLREPLPIARANPKEVPKAGRLRETPSSALWLAAARDKGGWADAEKPFWRDFPLWLSTGRLNSVGIAHNHMHRKGVVASEAWGKPRDKARLPDPHGNGFWTQEIYYHALNCGFRIPPSAGSASGVLPNPVGYNRVYAHVDGELTWDKWWQSLREGRVFVTNGPLLRLSANGALPGRVFESNGPIELVIDGKLDSNDKIAAVELVTNGNVREISLPAKIEITESGWFLVRARADVKETFRFASTAPWYVEIGNSPQHISRSACDFFLRWTDDRIEHLKQAGMPDDAGRDVLKYQEQAKQFWTEMRARANAD